MKGCFVTGTDTGAGKTALSALLLAECRRRGCRAAPLKPVQTGCFRAPCPEPPGYRLVAPDLEYALAMADWHPPERERLSMAPFRFEPACSPHLAAEMAGTEVRVEHLAAAARRLAADFDRLIVEGAGGIQVPINRRETLRDLMVELDLPVVVAARAGLGTINHTLLSLESLRTAGLNVAGVVLLESRPDPPGAIERDNPVAIAQFGRVPVLGQIPFCAGLAAPLPAYASLPESLRVETARIVQTLWP